MRPGSEIAAEIRELDLAIRDMLRDIRKFDDDIRVERALQAVRVNDKIRELWKERDDVIQARRSLISRSKSLRAILRDTNSARVIGDSPTLTGPLRELVRRVGVLENMYFELLDHMDDAGPGFDWKKTVQDTEKKLEAADAAWQLIKTGERQ